MTACGACLLSTNTETPAMAETTVATDFPEPLQGLAHLVVQKISIHMGGLAILNVLLPVHEPCGHELQWVLDDSDELVDLLAGELASTLLRSTSAFLHTMLAKRRPTPRIWVMAKGTLWRPSTLVLRTRKMCWNWSVGKISAMTTADG